MIGQTENDSKMIPPGFHLHLCSGCQQPWTHSNKSLCKQGGNLLCDGCWDEVIDQRPTRAAGKGALA